MSLSEADGAPPPQALPASASTPLPPTPSQAKTVTNDSTVDMGTVHGTLVPGSLLGDRYRINRQLGRGGMGEVWQAYDLKLQVDVALKSILPERFPGAKGLELLRREVRAAREVMSPNVCRIFDLVDAGGQEFISMEYIDGTTLLEVLLERAPLELREAMQLASQFLAGLEAIHAAGLVHRDVKPENIMITRTGRVVLMDFGVAKGIAEDHRGTVAGTPAYMAPEQLRGAAPDPRVDIFSAGVVLAEMVAPEGIKKRDSREKIWEAVRQSPVRLSESPWRRVLERSVASDVTLRYGTVRELARALEEVTVRVEGAEDKQPYPGLSSFTAADAEFFFGREAEVEAVWKKLQRAYLLGIIGPSGAGKTSFLQAGLLPAAPSGWRHVLVRPGASPFVALAQALVTEMAGDAEAMRELVEMDRAERAVAAVGRWRARHAQVLLVVDQFEELFTLCLPDVQAQFADLLGRLALDADVHVLLTIRDDFLFRCHEHTGLAPLFSELTPLGSPTGSGLRRALIQPALLCGCRFEDESLADEMLVAIEGERGALPMLAFTAARLWEQRDRERGILTREAYERIGGVSGALAQHAEATLERIGSERLPLVREMFRNLVTAQGTRAVVEVEELLSVFGDHKAANEVLSALVDARLLTAFEMDTVREGVHEHRFEIVHESLLARWPRLVRWRTQDADGAQLRDQLRQQARLWEERGRPDDLLWAGSSYREFTVWRECYPGGLTAGEEAFARAMIARAERQRRRRRFAASAAFAFLCAIIVVIGWFARSEQVARRRSEASRLLALGQTELESNPAAALAYGITSLELADTQTSRLFALKALVRGTAAVQVALPSVSGMFIDFSPDGRWLVVGGAKGIVAVPRDGSQPVVLDRTQADPLAFPKPQFAPDGDRIVFTSNDDPSTIRIWSLSQRREVRRFHMEGVTVPLVRGDRLFLVTDVGGSFRGVGPVFFAPNTQDRAGKWTKAVVRTWGFDEAEPGLVGAWSPGGITDFDIDRRGRWVTYPRGRGVYICPLDGLLPARELRVGEHTSEASRVRFDPAGERLASSDATGEVRIWSLSERAGRPPRVLDGKEPLCGLWFSPSGRSLAAAYASPDHQVRLWDLDGPQDADPLVLRWGQSPVFPAVAFDPTGEWIAVTYYTSLQDHVVFWRLGYPHPFVLRGPGTMGCAQVAFSRDSRTLFAAFMGGGGVRSWSLSGGPIRDIWKPAAETYTVAPDPNVQYIVSTTDEWAYLVSLADGGVQKLPGSRRGTYILDVAISPDGRLAAGTLSDANTPIVVWDLVGGGYRFFPGTSIIPQPITFIGDGRQLLAFHRNGEIRQWNLNDGSSSVLMAGLQWGDAKMTRDAHHLFYLDSVDTTMGVSSQTRTFVRYDLETQTPRPITTHGNRINFIAVDSSGSYVATSDLDGVTRLGPATGEEPHLLLAPTAYWGGILGISPDGRWIATPDVQHSIVYLWRWPSGKPLQTLPHDAFLERLRALTCFRAVPDRSAPTGYRLDSAPYSGWAKVPGW